MPDRHAETLEIEGMSCDHCVSAVQSALEGVSGAAVQTVEIGRATVDAGPEATRELLVAAVEDAGFTVTGGQSEPAPQ
ncbi:heavy-metal-associated domain-containing protein [Rubrivirga sp.]|uniref:heavy-metal-associated domain-containing protein n=1 Tax=Rubrivirga sp. TaxID=1885344 RepID=UPI003C77C4BE